MVLPNQYEKPIIWRACLLHDQIEHRMNAASVRTLTQTLCRKLTRGHTDCQEVVRGAEGGDLLAHLAIDQFFHDLLDHDVMPPACVRAYMSRPDLHGKGRLSWKNIVQDARLMLLVAVI